MSNGSYVRRAGTTEVVLVPMLEASEDHVARLEAEVKRLRALLAKHGTHTIECSVFDRMLEDCTCRPGRWSPERQHAADCAKSRRPPCDCGWVEVER